MNEFKGLLPIGTVVLLKNSTKRLMIIGVLQKHVRDSEKIWDYTGIVYPEGFMGPDMAYMFDSDQIEKVFAVGYQDEEQFAFKAKIDKLREQLKG